MATYGRAQEKKVQSALSRYLLGKPYLFKGVHIRLAHPVSPQYAIVSSMLPTHEKGKWQGDGLT